MPERLFVIPHALEVAADDTIKDMVSGIEELGISPALIFIDTLARSFGTGDENSTRDMNSFVAGCVALQQAFRRLHRRRGASQRVRYRPRTRQYRAQGSRGHRNRNTSRWAGEDLTIAKMKNHVNDNRQLHLKLIDINVPASDGLPSTHSAAVRLAGGPPARKEKPRNENEEKVMMALSSAPAGLTPQEVREGSGVTNKDTFRSVMERLSDKGQAHREGARWVAGPVRPSAA